MKRVKKFYDAVDVRRSSEGLFELFLDGKTVRTPLGAKLQLGSEPIASALATEWQLQTDFVVPNAMPMNTIVMTNMDIDSKMNRREKIDQINRFFQTDTIRFPDIDDKSKLSINQKEKWNNIFNLLESRGVKITQSTSLFGLPETTDDEILNIHKKIVDNYDSLKLTMLETGAKYLKSGCLSIGLIEGFITPQEAYEAAYVEELTQRAEWGLVEGDHDLNDAETMLWLNGIHLLAHLNSSLTH
jgi:ATP synthase F1 complex assembly factor 2